MQKGIFNGKKLSDLKPKAEAVIKSTVIKSTVIKSTVIKSTVIKSTVIKSTVIENAAIPNEIMTSEFTTSDAGSSEPNSSEPNSSQSDSNVPTTNTGSSDIESTDPNATDPNATGPNATGPNATGPNATGPNATGPSATGSSTASRPAISAQAIQLERDNRLERIRKEVLEAKSINAHKKVSLAREILNRGPSEVRAALLEGLQEFILALDDTEQKLMREARRSVVKQYPLESTNASLEAFFDEIETTVFQYANQQVSDYIIGQVLQMPAELLGPLRQHMTTLAQTHNTPWKAREYGVALKHLARFDTVLHELAELQRNASTPLERAQALIDGVLVRLREISGAYPESYHSRNHLHNLALKSVQDARIDVRQQLPRLLLEAIKNGVYPNGITQQMLHTCFESINAYSTEVRDVMLEYVMRHDVFHIHRNGSDYGLRQRMLKTMLELEPMPPLVVAVLRRTSLNFYFSDELKALVKSLPFGLNAGEAWADQAINDLEAMPQAEREAWLILLKHAQSDKSKPSEAWETQARALTANHPDFQTRVLGWLALVGKERTYKLIDANETFDAWNANIVRGLAWSLALLEPSDASARTLARLVETSLKKVPGVGPRSPKLATAGTVALGRLNTSFAVGQLARLKARVTFKTTLKEIEKALEESARRAGISKEDLEEIAVPSFGLEADGVRSEGFGEYRAELRIASNDVTLEFFDATKKLKTVPSTIKKEFAEELKDLKTAQKDIAGMLSASKARIEKLHLSQKSWTLQDWHERYLEHPLIGSICKRLIWRVTSPNQTGSSFFVHPERGIESVHGQKLELPNDARVTLWHPIQVTSDKVLEWRAYLEANQIKQPWKQAHREIYVLTAAEERTRTYSNRFAAHIIKQHQFAQLAAQRGWHNKLRLMVDDSYTPAMLELPEWGIRAEYWVEGIGEEYGVDTTETGTYLRLVTDQVRFYAMNAPTNQAHAGGGGFEMWLRNGQNPAEPIPLETIPALVLSEVLRDVDLFVGVASVGNDPTWNDGGPQGRFREYWQSYSFGELTETSQSRKALLEVLVPRLKIRDRAKVDGKFLRVTGTLREYKIHLGSGNILMEPNDQYLCIVPGQGIKSLNDPTANIQLPFEGDRTLAVILSKAFMLAEDNKITDITITRQLKR